MTDFQNTLTHNEDLLNVLRFMELDTGVLEPAVPDMKEDAVRVQDCSCSPLGENLKPHAK